MGKAELGGGGVNRGGDKVREKARERAELEGKELDEEKRSCSGGGGRVSWRGGRWLVRLKGGVGRGRSWRHGGEMGGWGGLRLGSVVLGG